MIAQPPPLDGLRAAPHVKLALARECVQGRNKPTDAANTADTELIALGATPNSCFAPPARVISRAAKSLRRKERGGSMNDGTRVDLLVRTHLVQRQQVLLYVPGQILVLSSPWALEVARTDGADMVVSDAKNDTVKGVQSKWSSIRTKTACGLSAPLAVWIGPHETAETIRMAATALALNVACKKASCDHAFIVTYGSDDQSIRMHRRCWVQPAGPPKSTYGPSVGIDKHMPSFRGFELAGYGWRSLCDYHCFVCFEEKLKGLGILGDAAVEVVWAFRLVKRSLWKSQAFKMRDEFAKFVVKRSTQPRKPWTLKQAQEIVGYLDRCWMYPDFILLSWIDSQAITQPGYISTTGWCEGSHAYYSNYMMHSMANKLISHTVVKTAGVSADGSAITGFFPDAERRCREEAGRTQPISTDAAIRRARAQLVFLEHGDAYREQNGLTTLVHSFGGTSTAIRRHAESASERRTHGGFTPDFPPELEPMRRLLKNGGPHSFSKPGWYAVRKGRCDCYDDLWRGGSVCSVGLCKHAIYAELRSADDCLRELKRYLHERERAPGLGSRTRWAGAHLRLLSLARSTLAAQAQSRRRRDAPPCTRRRAPRRRRRARSSWRSSPNTPRSRPPARASSRRRRPP